MVTCNKRVIAFVAITILCIKGLIDHSHSVGSNVPPLDASPPSSIVLDPADVIARRRNMTLFPPPLDHPFAGARDANGRWGYVADPTSLRMHVLGRYRRRIGDAHATYEDMIEARYMIFDDDVNDENGGINETDQVCRTPPGHGIEGEGGWDVLANRIVVGERGVPLPKSPDDPREPPNGWEWGEMARYPARDDPQYYNGPEPPRIFCGMYTYHKRHYLLKAASESWAFHCDGFLAFSDVTDPTMGAVDLPHHGTEFYGNMWQKVRSIWCYIYTNYYNDFDYFHLAGDDTLMIVENLRNYLWSIDDDNGTKPLYLGGLYMTQNIRACGGGPGYTLNRVTLKWLVTEAFSKPDIRVDSGEDRIMGFTLRPYVRCYDTRDANGGKRYLGNSPSSYGRSCDDGHCDPNNHRDQTRLDYAWRNLTGVNLISSQVVSFHLLRNQVMLKRVHAILYKTCPNGTVLADALELV
ncbi:hypothetical protein ACHAXA_001316 [Cyclostephanos tholiformis]|uniref:Uncharacterized protein n=1 Tax=Cyclostephanos tholiformis TaxID=382380 RepID=A0ABD3RGW7_9STRA